MDAGDKIEEILQRLTKIETKLDDFNLLKDKTEEAYSTSKQNTKDVADIKSKLDKVTYSTVACLIAVVGFFIKFNFFK